MTAPEVTEEIVPGEGVARLVLSPTGRVAGEVRERGRPVAGARVRIVTERGAPGRWTSTGPDGGFEIPNAVPEGHRRLEVRRPERAPVFREVDVRAGARTEVRIDL